MYAYICNFKDKCISKLKIVLEFWAVYYTSPQMFIVTFSYSLA